MHSYSPQGTTTGTISLLLGHPDPATLLPPEFRDSIERALTPERVLRALQYGAEQGNPALIEFLAGRISREQQIEVDTNQVMITAGSTHAVDMIARLCATGAVIVEAPTYADSLHIFRDHGAELHGVALDEQGVLVEGMAALLKRLAASANPARLFYTIPNFHNPTGITLARERRLQILELARQFGLTIVEDDVYRDLAFDDTMPESFLTLAGDQDVEVMQIGSFSKTLAPGLRLGWVASSSEAIARFVGCGVAQMGGGASPLSAEAVVEFCQSGGWERHVAGLRNLYRMRRDRMLGALTKMMPKNVTWTKPAGGFFVWVTIPDDVTGREVKRRALERGVMVGAGEGYFLNPADGAHHLRLTYSFAPPDEIERAVQILAECVGG